jgi:hypothetical protein
MAYMFRIIIIIIIIIITTTTTTTTIIIIIIIYLSCSWATCRPVPVSRVQKSLRMFAMIPSASRTVVFHYPG